MTTKSKKSVKPSTVFDYKTIKTFEDACKKLDIDSTKLPETAGILEEFAKPIIAAYKLMIIYKAINDGWKPDWSNWDQYQYYPLFEVLSSGFGFSGTLCLFDFTYSTVGSRLCTDTSQKAIYIGEQFAAEYKDYFLFSE